MENGKAIDNGDVAVRIPGNTVVKSYDKRIVIKWWKMVTLVNNPSLIVDRLQKQIKDHKAEKSAKSTVVVRIIKSYYILQLSSQMSISLPWNTLLNRMDHYFWPKFAKLDQ